MDLNNLKSINNKHISKSWHKINGVLIEKKMVSERILQFIIVKTGKNARSIRFICFDEHVIKLIKGFDVKSRLKIKFMVKSTQWNDKWFTDCVAMEVSGWVKKEKTGSVKHKQLDMLDEIEEKNWKKPMDWGLGFNQNNTI